jgi:hypothetical protein
VYVWGCYSGKFAEAACTFMPKNETMNGDRYKLVMEENLIPFMNYHRQENSNLFMISILYTAKKQYRNKYSQKRNCAATISTIMCL